MREEGGTGEGAKRRCERKGSKGGREGGKWKAKTESGANRRRSERGCY